MSISHVANSVPALCCDVVQRFMKQDPDAELTWLASIYQSPAVCVSGGTGWDMWLIGLTLRDRHAPCCFGEQCGLPRATAAPARMSTIRSQQKVRIVGKLSETNPKHPRIPSECPTLDPFFPVQQVPAPDIFHPRITRPCADGHLEPLLDNVDESRFSYQTGHILGYLIGLVREHAYPDSVLRPLLKDWVARHRAVERTTMNTPFDLLDVAAWRHMAISLLIQGRPVCHTTQQPSDVNEVEVVLGIHPRTANVVDFEGYVVWLHPRGDR